MTDIIIAKHRNGAVCDVKMKFRNSEVRFVDVTDVALNIDAQGAAIYAGSKMNGGDMPGNDFMNNEDF